MTSTTVNVHPTIRHIDDVLPAIEGAPTKTSSSRTRTATRSLTTSMRW